MELRNIGFDDWFETHSADMSQDGCSFARVSAVDRGSYLVRNEFREVPAELSGRLSYTVEGPAELPCIGDWVTVQYHSSDTAAIIHKVFPRRTFLRRKSAGQSAEAQMIGANIDVAFIVQSCHFDFNPRRLDRYIVMAADGRVEPVVMLTKTDLVTPEELAEKIEVISAITNETPIAVSNVTGVGFDEFQQMLSPGRTYCLLGSSGVGKTTLINHLLGEDAYDTKAVSATGEGTHTTSRRQLIVLDGGAMLIDTPGMRELGVIGTGEGIDAGFEVIAALAEDCRYADCTHEHEPGCAVRAAIESGELSEDRYANYLKLKKEVAFNELSSLERRKKDEEFGKFIKRFKKRKDPKKNWR